MIKYNDWGKHLRLGNWLFLYAGLRYFAKKTENEIEFPNYFLWDYLKLPPNISNSLDYDVEFIFRQTNYTDEEKDYIYEFLKTNKNIKTNIQIGSNLQSEKWFIDDFEFVKSCLEIKEEKLNEVKEKYKLFFNKPTIGVGIRRGDFVNHHCFYQIPETWYEETLKKEFTNYQDYNVIIFSDDIDWCKNYYKDKNFLFAEPNNTHTHLDNFKHYHNNPMEQFILGILCDNFIGGSSTFSWWQMWYVKNFNGGKVVHSGKNLIGHCAKQFYNPDYYPKEWGINEIN
jgi:hypothetical protein